MLTPTKPVKSCECGGSCGGCCCCTKEAIGLGNVDNTSDLNKPLSTDMVNALSGKVDLDVFTQLKNRVLALESTITEIPDLKVRIGQCELDIIDHYEAIKRLQSTTKSMADTITELGNRVTGVNDALVTVDTRVDALETKDSNNVKLSGVNVQTIQGTLKANDPTSGATDKTLVTANWVSQTGNSAPNNLIHKSGNETKRGKLTFETNRPEGVSHQYATHEQIDDGIKRIIQRIVTPDGNATVKYLVIDSRYNNYGIASVRYDNGILNLTYTAIAGTFVPTFRIFQKDGNTYIGMDMPYHTGFTLQQLTYADNYGNNIFYSPLIDEYSTDYAEVAHT